MTKPIIFIIISIGIVYYSRASLFNPKSHGFYRFFAFELILILILINLQQWFINPLTIYQLLSWLFLFSSLILAVQGFYLLHKIGQPKDDFENTTILVTTGAYKYIRHPLYASLLLFLWGVFLKYPSIVGGILSFLSTFFLFLTAKVEERENIQKFGDFYKSYIENTKMFIPYLF